MLSQTERGPAFMVLDASERPLGTHCLVAEALSRNQVVRQAIADTVFAICDIVFLRHHRLSSSRESIH